MEYLKEGQYYIDRYDLHTIEECLDTVKMFQDVYLVSENQEFLQKYPKKSV